MWVIYDITAHMKGRKSVDHDYIFAAMDQDLREILSGRIKDNPGKAVSWPETNPIMGYVPYV